MLISAALHHQFMLRDCKVFVSRFKVWSVVKFCDGVRRGMFDKPKLPHKTLLVFCWFCLKRNQRQRSLKHSFKKHSEIFPVATFHMLYLCYFQCPCHECLEKRGRAQNVSSHKYNRRGFFCVFLGVFLPPVVKRLGSVVGINCGWNRASVFRRFQLKRAWRKWGENVKCSREEKTKGRKTPCPHHSRVFLKTK